jgi:23S rRNA (uracil1939-C5)-methyltransferase
VPRRPPASSPTAAVTVEVTALAAGGDAVGRQRGGDADGRVTFVPLAAPGELVKARLVREQKRVAWAELVAVEAPSAARVPPPCPLFGRCGGCQWQHVDLETQRAQKGAIVSRALGVEVGAARAAGPPFGYRDRARLAVGRDEAGAPAIGFRARRSHAVVDVAACPLLSPAAAAALPAVRAAAAGLPAGAEVALQAGRDRAGAPVVAALVGGRVLHVGAGAGAAVVAGSGFAADDPAGFAADDPAGFVDVAEPGGRPLWIPPGAFAQVGGAGNAALVALVAAALGEQPGRVLELHAGSGNFTRLLVARAPVVAASEADARAVARGRANVPEAAWSPAAAGGGADTVVIDPPREGLDAAGLAQAAAGRRLVYVSCDPQTMGRDAARLAARGLRLASAVAVDLMPQTHHVEVVGVFVR